MVCSENRRKAGKLDLFVFEFLYLFSCLKEAGLTAVVKHLTGLWTRGVTPNGLSASPSHYAREQDLYHAINNKNPP